MNAALPALLSCQHEWCTEYIEGMRWASTGLAVSSSQVSGDAGYIGCWVADECALFVCGRSYVDQHQLLVHVTLCSLHLVCAYVSVLWVYRYQESGFLYLFSVSLDSSSQSKLWQVMQWLLPGEDLLWGTDTMGKAGQWELSPGVLELSPTWVQGMGGAGVVVQVLEAR